MAIWGRVSEDATSWQRCRVGAWPVFQPFTPSLCQLLRTTLNYPHTPPVPRSLEKTAPAVRVDYACRLGLPGGFPAAFAG